MSTCEVCGKKEAIGVACVPFVPYSASYCQQCLSMNAHPWWILVGNTALCGSYKGCSEEWKQMVKDTCKHLHRSMWRFKIEVLLCRIKLWYCQRLERKSHGQ